MAALVFGEELPEGLGGFGGLVGLVVGLGGGV